MVHKSNWWLFGVIVGILFGVTSAGLWWYTETHYRATDPGFADAQIDLIRGGIASGIALFAISIRMWLKTRQAN